MTEELFQLAWLTGVQSTHWDALGNYFEATPDNMLGVLRALGVCDRIEEAGDGIRAELDRRRAQLCSPVSIAPIVKLRFPYGHPDGPVTAEVVTEAGDNLSLTAELGSLDVVSHEDDSQTVVRKLVLPALEVGYHKASITADDRTAESMIIAPPPKAYQLPATFGVFAPVYALRSGRSGGAGDLADLRTLARWVHRLGGELVGTLPLLAGCYTEPFESSPYSPLSRIFFNEIYADVGDLDSEEAHALAEQDLVDYRAQYALKRPLLERAAARAFDSDETRAAIEAFAAERPRVDDYARFRAVMDQRREPWTEWPAPLRDGTIGDGELDANARRFHLYVQYALHDQLVHFAADSDCAGLYLDLPVGASRTSYDVWRERASFASGAGIGAPPDELFSGGQDWGLPPVHPRLQREQHYRYFIDSVRAHVEHADMLRIDHVMGLHRLFWIPDGFDARDGLYVHYPAKEMYAILAIESARYRCGLAGEDLGTVPDEVRPAMASRGISRLYLAQFTPDEEPAAGSVASLGTHDTATFASYLAGVDPSKDSGQQMHSETLRIAGSKARVALVTLEDVWLETQRQNVPGSNRDGHPNWQRKLAKTLDEVMDPAGETATLLAEVNERRKSALGVEAEKS